MASKTYRASEYICFRVRSQTYADFCVIVIRWEKVYVRGSMKINVFIFDKENIRHCKFFQSQMTMKSPP